MSVWLLDCLSPEELLLRFLLLWLLVTSSTCPSTGSAAATTTASWLSSSQPIPSSMQGYELRLMKASSLNTLTGAPPASISNFGIQSEVDWLSANAPGDVTSATRQSLILKYSAFD